MTKNNKKNKNTETPQWDVTAICPMDIIFGFPLGATQNNSESLFVLKTMSELKPSISVDTKESERSSNVFKGSEYVSIAEDVSTIRLFIWRGKVENPRGENVDVIFHVFPNHIAVAEIRLRNIPATTAIELDDTALKETEYLLIKAKAAFNKVMDNLAISLKGTKAIFDAKESHDRVYWPSRALQLSRQQVSEPAAQELMSDWLKDTHRPDDSKRLVNGEIDESITWLKYVIVEPDHSNDYRIDTLILAQYCYSAQEKCNRRLRQAIEWAFQGENKKLEKELQRAKQELEKSRVLVKLHQVCVNECLRHLTRKKSRLIKDIFTCWEYQRLVENGNAMLDLCADKINDSNSRQAKISAYKTEYILIGISLFTVLDFFFFITQFSREAMANPTLDHNDGGPSSFLTFVAEIPADTMFFVAVIFAGLIFLAYKKVKG